MSAPKNRLYYGDNLDVLRAHVQDETVDLCYIDPPFNSKRNYNQLYNNVGKEDKAQAQAFADTWTWNQAANEGLEEITSNRNGLYTTQSIYLIIGLEKVLGKGSLLAYLVSITQRMAEIYRALKPTGSFYLHCDPTASHYLKLVLDCMFLPRGGEFLNEITWKRYAVHSLSKKRYDAISDIIFFYSKSTEYRFNAQYEAMTKEELNKRFPYLEKETGRHYQHVALEQSANKQSAGEVRFIKGQKVSSELGWRWTQATFDERLAKNPYLIYWTETGKPRYKIYADEYEGKPVSNIWTDIPYLSAGDKERLGYPTQKPEALLERIIKASSREGDTVLDCYCGCGTTIAVAERLKRNWIGVDITYQSISLILKRLEDSFGTDFSNEVAHKDTKKPAREPRVVLSGVPQDFESAVALAHRQDDRVRKEFEKWVVLTYSNNRAVINDKKGGDGGIDGTAFMLDGDAANKPEFKEVIFSVKSNKTLSPAVIRDLFGTIEREKAAMGYLITLYPMPNLVKEAEKYGTYNNKLFGHSYPKIQVITIQQILNGERMHLPASVEVLKKAERKVRETITKNLFNQEDAE